MKVARPAAPLPIVVLISGNGTNLQAIIDAIARGHLPAEIRAVISNRAQAPGLDKARRAGIPAEIIDHTRHPDRDSFDAALQAAIDRYHPELVVLAGFMRILTPALVKHYHGRMLNIHPSLLPAFPGLDTHRRALAAKVKEHGVSIHFVTDQVDGGPVIIQKAVPVLPGDDAAALAARVQREEHRLYPRAIRWFAEGRVKLHDQQIMFEGAPLAVPLAGESA